LIDNFVNLIATAVSDAAARIEAECFRLAYPDARILVVPVPDKMGKALIAVDQDDLVVGVPARRVWRLEFLMPACRNRCPQRK
jgi:transcriptional regulator of acetoin/glycerol metabolism